MKNIKIHELGLRDGLQIEQKVVPIETKIKWADALLTSGVDILQLGSFVNPEKVPQMASSDELFKHYEKNGKPNDTILSGFVLNEKGMERGMKCGVEMFCMGVSASETHSKKNTGMTTSQATEHIIKIALEGQKAGKIIQVSVQSAFGCGYEGKIDESKVLGIIRKYIEAGLMNISLADTAGHAYPEQVKRLYSGILEISENAKLTCHFHNTYGLGIANCYTAIDCGVENIETAFGGLGGCPFTKIAAGNVTTEDFVLSLNRNGQLKNINLDTIIDISKEAEAYFEKPLEGYVYKIGKLNYL